MINCCKEINDNFLFNCMLNKINKYLLKQNDIKKINYKECIMRTLTFEHSFLCNLNSIFTQISDANKFKNEIFGYDQKKNKYLNNVNSIIKKYKKKSDLFEKCSKYKIYSRNEDIIFECVHNKQNVNCHNKIFEKFENLCDYELLKKDNVNFLDVIFCCILRYSFMFQINMHLWNDEIYKKINFDLEMFACPVNSHLTNYCSLYYDIDKYFKSKGSLFCMNGNLFKNYKIVFANPPFDVELINKLAEFIENIFVNFNKNITFVVNIPDWRKYRNYKFYDIFKKYSVKLKSLNVDYKNHFVNKNIKIKSETLILILKYKN